MQTAMERWRKCAIVGAFTLAGVCTLVLSSPSSSPSLSLGQASTAQAGELQALAPWASTSVKRAALLRTIREEAQAAGVPLFISTPLTGGESGVFLQTLLADTRIGGGGSEKKGQLLDYIQQQQHILSKIESLSGVYALSGEDGGASRHHHFPEKSEHYHNVFAKHEKEDADYDPDAFSTQQPDNSGDASARAWHMIDPSSSTAKYEPKHRDDSWHGEEDALSAIQANAEERLKKDEKATQDETGHDATFDNAENSTVVDDSGEEVPSDSIAAVASAMGYKSVKVFLKDEKKEAAAARAEAIKEEKAREKVHYVHAYMCRCMRTCISTHSRLRIHIHVYLCTYLHIHA
jgi:hypothetical protein